MFCWQFSKEVSPVIRFLLISGNVIVYSLSEELELIKEPPASAIIFNLLEVIHSSPSLSNN